MNNGPQYGFEYHFNHLKGRDRDVVYNWVDGCVWRVFMHSDYFRNCDIPSIWKRNQQLRAGFDAERLCAQLNGHPLPVLV